MIKNNKGYMLVEIILASAIAFGIAYFIINLTIKLKNKNDDLMVETLMNTDKTIITNKLMTYMIEENENFSCSNLSNEGNTITYNGEVVDVVNDYAIIDSIDCSNTVGKISIKIPTTVVQMKDQNFDIVVDYKYEIGDMTPPTCSLSVGSNNVITATYSDNDGGSGILEYGISKNNEEEYNMISEVDFSLGTYYCYVKDKAENTNKGQITITNASRRCPSGYTDNGSGCYRIVSYNSYYSCGCCNVNSCTGAVAWAYSSTYGGCSSACASRGYDWYSATWQQGSPNYSYSGYSYRCNSGTRINVNGGYYCYQ